MKGYTSGRHTMREAAELAAAAGYEWAALELDDVDTSEYNRDHWGEYVAEFHGVGMLAGSWFTEGGGIRDTPSDADLSIAELEGPWGGPGDYEGIMMTIAAGRLPRCPIAICTNFSAATRVTARPLLDAGFACLTEAYLNENPLADPDGLDRMARDLGWATSQPVAGVYPVGGQPPPSYAEWADWPMADYLGEYVL